MASPITAATWPGNVPPARVWPLRLSAWLLLAMVLAQTMGFVHGTAHVRLSQAGHLQSGAIASDAVGNVTTAVARLFDNHDEEAECRLYDQMGRGECAPTADRVVTPSIFASNAPAAAPVPWPCGVCLPARARGPPSAS